MKVTVIVETPKGSRNKYAFDPESGAIELSRVLPEGMIFPNDFGFIPGTKADDGDPIDVLLLMDAPAFPGCRVESRLIGVIEGEQTEKGETNRNDRLIAVAEESYTHSDVRELRDLNRTFLKEIDEFFIAYHKVQGRTFKVLRHGGPGKAARLLRAAYTKEGNQEAA
ncbi:MAG TPA: inorganic diphosphatase [Terriglobia bacterium]|jgi:inorganic pyrophosphatase